jgi:hypothetical protein
MNAVNEIETLVANTVRTITLIADRVTKFATVILGCAAVAATGSFLLGAAALSGGIRTVWIVLGIAFAVLAIGAAATARWRIGRVRKNVPALAAEVRTLLRDGKQSTVEIIDQFQDGGHDSATGSAIVLSRRVDGLRGVVSHGLSGSAKLTETVAAITSFPWLALAAIGISIVFGFLGVIFLLALALG